MSSHEDIIRKRHAADLTLNLLLNIGPERMDEFYRAYVFEKGYAQDQVPDMILDMMKGFVFRKLKETPELKADKTLEDEVLAYLENDLENTEKVLRDYVKRDYRER